MELVIQNEVKDLFWMWSSQASHFLASKVYNIPTHKTTTNKKALELSKAVFGLVFSLS